MITGDFAGWVTEDSSTNPPRAALNIADPDEGENIFKALAAAQLLGKYGNWTFNNMSGDWTYNLDNKNSDVQDLDEGNTLTESLTVNSFDNTASKKVEITINGQNENNEQKPIRTLAIGEAEIRPGKNISIPIKIDQGLDLLSADLKISYDTSVFKPQKSVDIMTTSEMSSSGSFLSNANNDGIIRTSWHTVNPLPEGGGIFAYLNLKTRKGPKSQSTKIDLVSGSLNEDEFNIILEDHELIIQPPTFQIFSVRQLPNGLILTLSEAPDLDILNIYDGKDKSIDAPDISLKDASGNPSCCFHSLGRGLK